MRFVKEHVTYRSILPEHHRRRPCRYCTAADRDARLICVVEQPENVAAVEKTRGFRGRYHVLMGAIAAPGIGPDELKSGCWPASAPAAWTKSSCDQPQREGEATALYLARLLKPLGCASRASRWRAVGSDLDYADEFTMSKAMEGRRV